MFGSEILMVAQYKRPSRNCCLPFSKSTLYCTVCCTIYDYCCGTVQYSFLSFYSVNSTKDLPRKYKFEQISHDDTFWILWNSHLQPLIRYVIKKYQQQTWKGPTRVF